MTTAARPQRTRALWWSGETPVALGAVPRLLPARPNGALVSVASVRRWARAGLLGVRLRTFAGGGRRTATTVEEVHRFLAALSSVRGLDA
jgi:hypothetical protein